VIGPPREAAADCPPTLPFAQAEFRIADLDRGKSCIGFLEQDECILALFRDCTYDHPRSWQGSLDMRKVVLNATYDPHQGVGARDPNECCGPLVTPMGEPPWAKLSCVIGGGNATAHAGFYLERADEGVRPYYRFSPEAGVRLATPMTAIDGFAPDFALLESARQLWALASGVGTGGNATGVYFGATTAAMLTRLATQLAAPSVIRASRDERFILVADGSTVHRIDTQTRVDMPLTVSGGIVEMEVIGGGLLVASNAPPHSTRLRMFAIDSLQPATDEKTIDGQVFGIIPLPTSTTSIALVVFDSPEVSAIDANLAVVRTFMPYTEAPTAYALIDRNTLALGYGTRYLEVDLETNRSVLDLKLPESDVRSLVFDPKKNAVIAGSRGGVIQVIDRAGMRPVLASSLALPDHGTASKLVYAPGSDQFYALAGSTGVIYPLAR
jgi:hypothetical protein